MTPAGQARSPVRWLWPILLLSACAAHGPVLPAGSAPVELRTTPFFAQQRYQCGPAALAMALGAAGVEVLPAALVDKVYIPDLQGSLQAEMVAAARGYSRIPYIIEPSLPALLAELRAGRPVLVLQNLGWNSYPIWHYAVVIGFRPQADEIVLRSGISRRKVVDAAAFLDDWRRAGRWGLLLLRPGDLPAGQSSTRFLNAVADMESHAEAGSLRLAYAAATKRWPDSASAWVGLGNSRYRLGELAGAERAFRRALAADADAVVARNNLADLLAERGCVDEARHQIERALAAAPPELAPAVAATQSEIQALPPNSAACLR